MNTQKSNTPQLIFSYKQTNYETWLNNLSNQVDGNYENGTCIFPEKFATGYAKSKIVEPGLSYRIEHYTLNINTEFIRTPTDHFQLIIYFYKLTTSEKANYKTGKLNFGNNHLFYSGAIITTSFTEQKLSFKKGSHVQGVSIQISEEWLKNNIKAFTPDRLAIFKKTDFVVDFITARQNELLYELFNNPLHIFNYELFLECRILKSTEQFLSKKNINDTVFKPIPRFTNKSDFISLLKIGHLLLFNYNKTFLNIDLMAKSAFMSTSKLKNNFKKAYGIPPFEYYQKNKMLKAKELLINEKYTVTQVGKMLGYQNLNNFTISFKKEFGYLPSQAC